MILDSYNEYSDAQTVTVDAGSTNVIDHGPLASGNTGRDLGAGEPIELVIQVDETVTADGAATVTFALQTDTDEAFGSAVTIWTSAAIGKATLVEGYQVVRMKLPRGAYKRYTRVYYTVATGPLTAGKFSAFLALNQQDNKIYAKGSDIL